MSRHEISPNPRGCCIRPIFCFVIFILSFLASSYHENVEDLCRWLPEFETRKYFFFTFQDMKGIWVSTTESRVKYWDISSIDFRESMTSPSPSPSAAATSTTTTTTAPMSSKTSLNYHISRIIHAVWLVGISWPPKLRIYWHELFLISHLHSALRTNVAWFELVRLGSLTQPSVVNWSSKVRLFFLFICVCRLLSLRSAALTKKFLR